MRIGYDISQTGAEKAGCGWFASSLLEAMQGVWSDEDELILYATFGYSYWDPGWEKMVRDYQRLGYELADMPTSEKAKRLWELEPSQLSVVLGKPDLVHSNNFSCPPPIPGTRLVYTLYDLSFLELPDLTLEANRLVCFDGIYQAALRADSIVAISGFSRDRFRECFPHFPADRIEIIHPASRFPRRLERDSSGSGFEGLQPGDFWLTVGTLEPRKNQIGLVKAYRDAASQRRLGPLVMVGGRGWLSDDLVAELESPGAGRIIRLGYAEDPQLEWLYSNCRAFLFPSFYEGFGMPVLEALSLGAPSLVSNTSSLPEIVGTSAIRIDPENPVSIRDGILELDGNEALRRDLSQSGLERSKRFRWSDSARRLLEIYQETLDRPARALAKTSR